MSVPEPGAATRPASQSPMFTDEQLKIIAGLIDEAANKAARAARSPDIGRRFAPAHAVPRRQVQVPIPKDRSGFSMARDGRLVLPVGDGTGELYDPETGELYDSAGARMGFHLELVHTPHD